MVTSMNINIEKLKDIVRRAGGKIMEIYGEEDFSVEFKDDKSPLTAADKASHDVIVAGLQLNWPDIPILSEEGADVPYETRKEWGLFWLVDPLDGTKEFIKRNGEFTVNIALVNDHEPILGVIYVPAQDKIYWGNKESGAWMQANKQQPEKITVRQAQAENGLTVVVSRSHPSEELEAYLSGINVVKTLPVGSSLKLCVVAEGKADLYPRLGPTMEWDIAAGHAVVTAAGGSIITSSGGKITYNKKNLLNDNFIVSSLGLLKSF